jgi:hypothetical protein
MIIKQIETNHQDTAVPKGVAKGGFTGSNPPRNFGKKIFGLTKENKYMHFNFISNTAVV